MRALVATDLDTSVAEVVLGGPAMLPVDGTSLSAKDIGPETPIVATRRRRGGGGEESEGVESSAEDADFDVDGPETAEADLEPMGQAPEPPQGPHFAVVDQHGTAFVPEGSEHLLEPVDVFDPTSTSSDGGEDDDMGGPWAFPLMGIAAPSFVRRLAQQEGEGPRA